MWYEWNDDDLSNNFWTSHCWIVFVNTVSDYIWCHLRILHFLWCLFQPFTSVWSLLGLMTGIHRFMDKSIGNNRWWVDGMVCALLLLSLPLNISWFQYLSFRFWFVGDECFHTIWNQKYFFRRWMSFFDDNQCQKGMRCFQIPRYLALEDFAALGLSCCVIRCFDFEWNYRAIDWNQSISLLACLPSFELSNGIILSPLCWMWDDE